MIDYEQMGKTIRKYRKAMGLSQEKLAEIMRLSREYISRLECGRETASLDTVVQLSRVLDITVDLLVKNSDLKEPAMIEVEIKNQLKDCSEAEKAFLIDCMTALIKVMKEHTDTI